MYLQLQSATAGTPMEDNWAAHFRLPQPMNMMERHDKREAVFIKQGTLMFAAIESCIERHMPNRNIRELNILDFGCGVGRISLPFFFKYGRPTHCVDVDKKCIAYLKETIPGANPTEIPYDPPTPFADNSFDVVYAVSVWTHLPPDKSDAWLREIKRILIPGGLALITTTSFAGLAARRKSLDPKWGWATYSDDELRKDREVFKPTPSPPGVTGEYGYAAHDPTWLKEHWTRQYMPVLETVLGGILGVQDINVLRRPSP
jgi:SAM-dependent methyltransferase